MELGIFFIAMYVIFGAATYVFAPRVGPNPIFGVRTSVTLASREVWDAANRIGGLLLVAAGLGLVPVVAIVALLDLDDGAAKWTLMGYVVVSLLALGIWATTYPPRLQERRRGR